MEKLVLDTSALLHVMRGKTTGQAIKAFVGQFDVPQLIISVVTIAEIDSFMVQNKWGEQKRKTMHKLVEQCIVINIEKHNEDLRNSYVQLDAYSKRKLESPEGIKLEGSAKTMGKNDLWIAATAYTLNATLLSTDGHFDHLNKVFIAFKKFTQA